MTSTPTIFVLPRIVWLAISPTCATNFLKPPDLLARLAGADVAIDHPLLSRVKGPVHRQRQRERRLGRSLVASLDVRPVEERGVPLDLYELELGGGVHD